MKYRYTDFDSLPVSIELTVGEISSLIEFIANSNADTNKWTVSRFENLLVESLNNTAALMEAQSKNMMNTKVNNNA